MQQFTSVSHPTFPNVAHNEIGEAIGRLLKVAQSDTGQSRRVADFLLAWWNGDDMGHFPILHLCNVDRGASGRHAHDPGLPHPNGGHLCECVGV